MEALEGFLDELYGDFWVTMLKGLHTLRLRNKNIYIFFFVVVVGQNHEEHESLFDDEEGGVS